MATTATNVTAAKPKVGGEVYRAPLGTTLPTDATSALNAAFKSLGYNDASGLANDNNPVTQPIKAAGGDVVLNVQTEKNDTFKVTLIEALNDDVLKAVYGDGNVTVSGSLITVEATTDVHEDCCWVFELILRNGSLKRIVLPCASITSVGTITYADDVAVGYQLTISATPDASGKSHHEYIKKA